ncbi:serine hydrolase domain-containing protein [Streptosporangium canum]|uniref:serine hydrolase domain-containing protein n=1 Tax=Streptosporangium canum TaxID=324952 RepID=UPI00341B0B41
MSTPNDRALRGDVAPGWEPVLDAFAAIMSRPEERGAGLHVIHRGRTVADLYGGTDGEGPYGPDTRQVIFSASKGIAAACLAVLADRGDPPQADRGEVVKVDHAPVAAATAPWPA